MPQIKTIEGRRYGTSPATGSDTKDKCLLWLERMFYSRDNLVTLPETENNMDHDRVGKVNLRLGVKTLEVVCFLEELG